MEEIAFCCFTDMDSNGFSKIVSWQLGNLTYYKENNFLLEDLVERYSCYLAKKMEQFVDIADCIADFDESPFERRQ